MAKKLRLLSVILILVTLASVIELELRVCLAESVEAPASEANAAEKSAAIKRPYCEIELKDFPGLPVEVQKKQRFFDNNYLRKELFKKIPELKSWGEEVITVHMPAANPALVYLSLPGTELPTGILSEAARIVLDEINWMFGQKVSLLATKHAASDYAARGAQGKLDEFTSLLEAKDLSAEEKRLGDHIGLLRQELFKLELKETEIAARQEFLTRKLQPSLTADEIRARLERKPRRLHVPPAEQEGTAKPIMVFITPTLISLPPRHDFGTDRAQVEVEAKVVEALATDSLLNPGGEKWQWPIRAIFSDEEFQSLWRTIDSKDWAELLSAPRVTTLSGQQACIEVVKELTYAIEFDIENGLQEAKPTEWEHRDVGIILNMKPTASMDGNIIAVDFSLEVSELIRWQNYGTKECPINQPVFETRRCAANVRLASGQTFLMSSEVRPQKERGKEALPMATEKEPPDLTGELIRLESEMAGVRSSLKRVQLELEKCQKRRETVLELLPEYEQLKQELDARKELAAEAWKKLIEAKDALAASQPRVTQHPSLEPD